MREIHFEHCVLRDAAAGQEFECSRCGKRQPVRATGTAAAMHAAKRAFLAQHAGCAATQEARDEA